MSGYSHADLGLVRTFEAVADRRSFSAAARALDLSQSTVSDHVRLLEVKVGRTLLTRTTRSLALTTAGETMLTYARALLEVSSRIGEHFSRAVSGQPLRIGLAPDLAGVHLSSLLRLFHIDNPDCDILVRATETPELLRMLEAQEIDIVVGKQRVGGSLGRAILRSPAVWIGQGHLVTSREQPVPLVVSLLAGSVSRCIALEALETAGLSWRIVMEGDSMTCLRGALEAGIAVSVGAANYLPDFASPILEHPVLPPLADQEYFLTTRPAGASRAVALFSGFVEELLRQVYLTGHRAKEAMVQGSTD